MSLLHRPTQVVGAPVLVLVYNKVTHVVTTVTATLVIVNAAPSQMQPLVCVPSHLVILLAPLRTNALHKKLC
jgi:hypothetical protein